MTGQQSVLKTFVFGALPVTFGLVLVIAGYFLTKNFLLSSPQFFVKEVMVLTEGPAQKDELIKLAAIPASVPLFSLDLKTIQSRIENDPWVASANVSRVLPNKVVIRYEAEVPVAIINFQGLHYVNREGKIFAKVSAGDSLQFPLIQFQGMNSEFSKINLKSSLEVLKYFEKSKIFSPEDISEIVAQYSGDENLLSVLVNYPPKLLKAKYTSPGKIVKLTLNVDSIREQLVHAESIFNHLLVVKKAPKHLRLELGKKVVVKLNQ